MAGNNILLINENESLPIYFREKLSTDGGYSVLIKSDVSEGLEVFKQDNFDIVISSFGLDNKNEAEFIQGLKSIDPDCVIIAIIDGEKADVLSGELLRAGVYGIITKPFSSERLFFLVKKGIELHTITLAHRKITSSLLEQNAALQKQNTLLAKRVEEATNNLTRLYEDLRLTYMRTIKALAQAIDARDHYTHSHSENVANYAVTIAQEMHLFVKEVEIVRDACQLHDLGKIGIEDKILLKPSSLDKDEWDQVKRHPITGAQILEPLTFLSEVIHLVRQHHEHYNGSGYPDGLKEDGILQGARIIHLADAYEAMTSARAYRKIPLTKEEAVLEVIKNSGTQFDPIVVEAFLRVKDKL